MEYRSRLKRHKKESGGGRAVIAIIMIAGLVVLAASSKAGTWIAQNVMAPIFEALREEPGEVLPEDVSTDGAVAVSLAGPSLTSRTVTATLSAISVYALQTGVYSVEENALAQSDMLKGAGGGGYVFEEGGRYRVLAAGYPDSVSAGEIKDRLIAQGMDATVYHITSPSAAFRVTVASDEADAVQAAFPAMSEALAALTDIAVSFDGTDATVDSAKAELEAISAKLASDTAVLDSHTDKSEALALIAQCRDTLAGSLRSLIVSDAQSVVDFSAEMKYTQLYTVHQYVKLMDAFA